MGTCFFALIIRCEMSRMWQHPMSNLALFHVKCGTIPCQLCHYSMSAVALFHVSCGTIPCQLWHYSMSAVALFHVNCGTIPCQLWHYSMSAVALFHVSCGTIPWRRYHYLKQIECFLKTLRHFRGLCDIKLLTVQSFVYILD